MKKLILSLIFVLVGINAFAGIRGPDNGTTWPFGKEILFPWSKVNGIWQAHLGQSIDDTKETYFVFKVRRLTTTGEYKVKVIQYDPFSCTILGKSPAGSGLSSPLALGDTKNYIEGKIKGANGEFNVSVHAFNASDIIDPKEDLWTDISNTVMVMKLTELGHGKQEAIDTQLIKVSDRTEPVCDLTTRSSL